MLNAPNNDGVPRILRRQPTLIGQREQPLRLRERAAQSPSQQQRIVARHPPSALKHLVAKGGVEARFPNHLRPREGLGSQKGVEVVGQSGRRFLS